MTTEVLSLGARAEAPESVSTIRELVLDPRFAKDYYLRLAAASSCIRTLVSSSLPALHVLVYVEGHNG